MSVFGSTRPRPRRGERGDAAFAEALPSSGFLTVALEHAVAASVGSFVSLLALLALQDPDVYRSTLALVSAGLVLPAVAGFSFPSWALTLRRTMVAGILCPVGLLLPILDTGPGPGRRWLVGVWSILALAPLFAVLCDQMLVAGSLLRAATHCSPWFRRGTLGLVAVPLLSLWTMTTDRSTVREFSRMDLALDLHRQLTEYYPHWDTAPLGPDELWERYRGRLTEAEAGCGVPSAPCPAYLAVLREMFAELRNGHTEILVQNDAGRPAIEVAEVEGRAIVVRVEKGSDASRAGIEPGMEIVAVDGRSVESTLARVPGWRTSFASPRMREFAAFQALLEGPSDESVRIAVRSAPLVPARVVALERDRIRYEWEVEESEPLDESELRSDPGDAAGGVVYVHLDGFEGAESEDEFDEVVDRSLRAPGMILDLRDNYGGILDQSFRMMGRLLHEPVVIGEHCVAPRDPESREVCTSHRIEPRGPVYPGPLAVLIDENVFSAGELAAFALCRSGRARCFGTTTAGETDCVFRLDLPGAVARMSWAGFRPAFGPPLQGAGVEPDERVAPTVQDVRAGADPVLEAARVWIAGVATRPAPGERPRRDARARALTPSPVPPRRPVSG